ncbi:hypothetical protein HXX76_003900 [Chlamydomonas incerta]|uniref:Uncharacterized protein n=1 Tax=Chlamydomonas incerta TaxID=51695 RepID=A0A835TCC8_CHLIN|nr:hypothetical protein HXX76_003900 [Chlamydomonas incerta]|eukprot:KAG2441047.1 hypothetical protein HXX76_003900 [Chlamydomonas incerta]
MATDMPVNGLGSLALELVQKIASFMDPSDVALNLRPICSYFASALNEYRAARLRTQPPVRYCSMSRRGVFPPRLLQPVVARQPWPAAAFVACWRHAEPWRALNRRQRLHVLSLASSSLHGPSLDAALARCRVAIGVETLASAAAAGDLCACKKLFRSVWYRRDAKNDASLACAAAAHNGHLRVCRWLLYASGRRHDARLRCDLVLLALHAGHVGFAEHYVAAPAVAAQDADWGDLAVAAAEGGRLQLLARLAGGVSGPWCSALALGGVAYGCDLEALQRYHSVWGGEGAARAWQQQHLLLRALASPTPDWRAKAEWVLEQWSPAERRRRAALLSASIPEVVPAHRAKLYRHLAAAPDCLARLRYLAGVAGFALPAEAAVEAAAAGDVAAVEFCLEQEQEQVEQELLQPAARPLEQAVQRVVVAAAYAGQVPVLRRLRARGFELPHRLLMEIVAVYASRTYWGEHDWRRRLPAVQYLLLEPPGGALLGYPLGPSDWGWRSLFRTAARYGVDDTAVLRVMHQQCGTAIHLESLARGGSEEQLEWAAAALAAAGQQLQLLRERELVDVLCNGNLAAADWVIAHDLGPPRAQLWRLVWRLLVQGEHGGLPLSMITWVAMRAGGAVSAVRCVALACWALAAWQAWAGLHDKAMRMLTRGATRGVLAAACVALVWSLVLGRSRQCWGL